MIERLKTFFSKNKNVTPSYKKKRKIIDSYRQTMKTQYFVETGTFLGDTVDFFKDKFEFLYSIELSEELANKAKKRFINDKNITIIQGDSGKVLGSLIHTLDKPTLFWLDGHYSSEFFYKGEFIKTAKSDKNTPIEQELDIILESPNLHVILIDDARLFTGESDYPTIETLRLKLASKRDQYILSVSNDIIHIIPNKAN